MQTLEKAAQELFNIKLSTQQKEAFAFYARELARWNEMMNLTAITEPEQIEIRHFLDSLSAIRVEKFKPGTRVADVGTGAGFPGLPLKILCPQIELTLIEATRKKTEFLDHIIAGLNLTGITAIHSRAEEAGNAPDHRERYDITMARAVAALPVLAEYLLPLTRVGGCGIAFKGESAIQEANEAAQALKVLGGEVVQVAEVELPGVTETHYLIHIRKVAATPADYPRRPGMPAKNPL
jgi:16S rRNA (guanine527-N7)-methyltransferase